MGSKSLKASLLFIDSQMALIDVISFNVRKFLIAVLKHLNIFSDYYVC